MTFKNVQILHRNSILVVETHVYTGWLKKSKLLTQYSSLLF